MKCKSQPQFLAGRASQVTDVWEVKLPKSMADRLRRSSTCRKSSYSSITRYCAFRLAEKEKLRWSGLIVRARGEIRKMQAPADKRHRHMVCFYGEDIKLIKLAAMALNISVSEFIRIALWLYLPRLVMDSHNRKYVSDAELFWLGIKRWLCIPLGALNNARQPTLRRYLFSSFPPAHWWPPRNLHLEPGAMRFLATA